MHLSLAKIASMCGGVLSAGSNPDLVINNVVIDSRLAKHGTLFVALMGENHDGHDFVRDCLIDNSCAALVRHDLGLPNLICVADTTIALGLIAHNYRLQFNIPIVAITGSNGKTTVKEMLSNICRVEFGSDHVLATFGNLNNHLGMPLTLLNLNSQHRVAILEMGMNHSGELHYLSHLANPSIAVVNNAMLVHAEFFQSIKDIAIAKGEIYNGIIDGGIACINESSEFASLWHSLVNSEGDKIKTLGFGTAGSFCYLKSSDSNGRIVLATKSSDISCRLQVLGEHNKLNALTATVLALQLGCKLTSITEGLSSYAGYKGRLEKKQAFNNALIIDDSYNANPDSVKAAIIAIRDLPKPHWFVFADLGELGEFMHKSHQEIAVFAKEHGIDVLLTTGENTKITHANFSGIKMHFTSSQDIVEYCRQNLPANATLLVKGSHSMNMAYVVNKLTK